jgi:hypothetical protein
MRYVTICLLFVASPAIADLLTLPVPLQLGRSWSYQYVNTEEDEGDVVDTTGTGTFEVSVVGTTTVDGTQYLELNDSGLYRMSTDQQIWRLDRETGEEILVHDVWRPLGEGDIIEDDDRYAIYEGVFQEELVHVLRRGPFTLLMQAPFTQPAAACTWSIRP